MSAYTYWVDVLPKLLRDARFRAELIDRLEDEGDCIVTAAAAGTSLSDTDQERLAEELGETFAFLASRVVSLDWEDSTPMGGCGASWIDGFADVYWFGSSDWEGQGPFESISAALGASSSFDTATYGAWLRSEVVDDAQLLSIGASICPHDGDIYINSTRYRHGEDGLEERDD